MSTDNDITFNLTFEDVFGVQKVDFTKDASPVPSMKENAAAIATATMAAAPTAAPTEAPAAATATAAEKSAAKANQIAPPRRTVTSVAKKIGKGIGMLVVGAVMTPPILVAKGLGGMVGLGGGGEDGCEDELNDVDKMDTQMTSVRAADIYTNEN